MAIQTIRCPNCNGEVQLDDSFEKGYCMYCGSAIQVQDASTKIKVEHSGKVEIDDSKKLSNAIALADRAFQSFNYEECYNYCCAALECDVNNARMIFLKGLCAAYISFDRINELEQAMETAADIIRNSAKDPDSELHAIFSGVLSFIRSSFAVNDRSRDSAYPSFVSANEAFFTIFTLTSLSADCAMLITEEMMEAHPTYENDKKACLEHALALCDLGVSSFEYFDGYETVKRGDNYVQKEVYKTMKPPFADAERDYQTRFKNIYNNLPTTRKALMEYNGEIDRLQKDIEAYQRRLEGYLDANPELKKAYKKRAWPFVILTAALFMVTVITAAVLFYAGMMVLFVVVTVFLSLGLVAMAVLTVVKAVSYSKRRKRILSELPSDIASMKMVHDNSVTQLRSVEKTKAAFVKKNVKK